jgi:hypothetical protein
LLSIWSKAVLLVLAPAMLALGVTLPLMRFESFYFLKSDASLVDIVSVLWAGGDILLSVLVALLSIVFPLGKLVLVTADRRSRPWLDRPACATSLTLVDDGCASGCDRHLRYQDQRVRAGIYAAGPLVLCGIQPDRGRAARFFCAWAPHSIKPAGGAMPVL